MGRLTTIHLSLFFFLSYWWSFHQTGWSNCTISIQTEKKRLQLRNDASVNYADCTETILKAVSVFGSGFLRNWFVSLVAVYLFFTIQRCVATPNNETTLWFRELQLIDVISLGIHSKLLEFKWTNGNLDLPLQHRANVSLEMSCEGEEWNTSNTRRQNTWTLQTWKAKESCEVTKQLCASQLSELRGIPRFGQWRHFVWYLFCLFIRVPQINKVHATEIQEAKSETLQIPGGKTLGHKAKESCEVTKQLCAYDVILRFELEVLIFARISRARVTYRTNPKNQLSNTTHFLTG